MDYFKGGIEMKKDIKNFVEENKDKMVLAITYDKDKKAGKKFDIVFEIPDDEKDTAVLVNKLQSCVNVLEAMKSGIEIRKLF